MSCLYIFEINSLSVASFAIIFSHSEGCIFTLLIVSFVVKKLLSLIRVPFIYFCFYFYYSGRWVIEDPAVFYVKSVLPVFFSRSFIVSVFTFRSLIHFELISVIMLENVLVSFFYKWLTSFPSTTC